MPTAVASAVRRPPGREPRQPIRISYVIDNLSRAGTETQLLALLRTLDRSRFEPTLVLLDGENDLSRAMEPTDCRVIRLGVRRLLSVSAVRAARRLRDHWRADPPAVVQAYFLDSSYFAVAVARRVGVPHVLRVRNNLGYWLTLKHRLLGRLIRPWVGLTLTNSETGRDALMRHDGLASERVAVIENGVDLERFAELPPPVFGRVVRVGCLANLRAVKNIDGLIRAARLVLDQHPGVVFEVGGEGEERPKLEELIRRLGLTDRFRLRGRIDDVPAFLRTLDVAVLPSHSESLSNAVLEYMAAGRTVIATDVGANAQVIRRDCEGVIVPPGDDAALAAPICNLIADPAAARAMAARARDRVIANYSREAMRRNFEQLYLRLVERSSSPRRGG